MYKNVLVIAENPSAISELTSGARTLGEKVTLVYARERSAAVGADEAYYIGDLADQSFINFIPAISALAETIKPELILVSSTKNGRLAAGILAARTGTTVLTDISECALEGNGMVTSRLAYGGKAIKTEYSDYSTVIACLGSGVFACQTQSVTESIKELAAENIVSFIGKKPKEGKTVNLGVAKRIICAGRGAASQEAIDQLKKLASIMEAEVGCTRPIAEDEKLMPVDTYIGVSGLMLKPEVYLGVGVSGQVQHSVGVSQSGVFFAVNKDAKAPIFSQCDYGIVGDLNTIIPELIELLSKE